MGNTAKLEDLAALLGKSDEETADKFGGGAKNWSADHALYIGRTYETEVDGIPCKAFITCSGNGNLPGRMWPEHGVGNDFCHCD